MRKAEEIEMVIVVWLLVNTVFKEGLRCDTRRVGILCSNCMAGID